MSNSVELEPIYVRISPNGDPRVESHLSASDDESESLHEPVESFPPVEPPAPKRKWRRCCFAVLVFFTVFWATSVLVSGYFVVTSVRQCIHPPHHRITSLSFTPEEITGLDLFAVSGTVTVHSCPHAKNISIRISEGAANEDLLSMMETKYTVKHKVLHLFSMGPSFDWFHCQMSHIEVLVPSSAVLNLTAQTISGIISVQARANFDRVDLGTSFGIIKSSHLHVEKALNIRAIFGYVSLHEVKSNVTHVEIQTGVAHLHEFKGINTRVQIKVGLAHLNALESQKELFMEVDVGSICARDIVPAKTTHAVVEYGHLRLRPRADSCYAFLMETHYGQLNVIHFTDHHHHSKMGALTAKKSGIVGTERAHSNIFVSSSYGHVTLVTEKPIVWNPEGHKVAEGHKTTTKSEVN